MDRIITHEEYEKALAEKIKIEKYLEHLTRITRAYMYQWESERVSNRKIQSAIDEAKQQK